MGSLIDKGKVVDKISDLFLDKYEAKANNDLTEFYKGVLKILINEKSQSNWISVKDRLPDNIKDVIICDEFGLVYPANYYTFDKCWMYSFTAERCNHKITHWMPLPQKPESENEDA